MKGVVLAGGTGSRLLPLTKVTNKHLLPVGREPMIFHPIRKLVEAGIAEIVVVTGAEHCGDMIATLGSGRDLGCDLTYRVQDRAGGIAEALGLVRAVVNRDGEFGYEDVCVILGDNVFEDPLSSFARQFKAKALRPGERRGAHVVLKAVDDAYRFGVATLSPSGDKILAIEEKPAGRTLGYAVTGIYFYDGRVFNIVSNLVPSARGELEITDVNNAYLKTGDLTHGVLRGYWTDAGTHESLARANVLVGR